MEKFSHVIIETSAMCNLKCIMCPTLNYKEGFGIMEDAVFDKLIDSLDNVSVISLEGWGEPLLDKKIFERVKKSKNKATIVDFTTNATLFDQKSIDAAKDSGIDAINISIDGGSKDVYEHVRVGSDFNRTMRNVELLKKAGLNIKFTMTLSKLNYDDVLNLLYKMTELGIRELTIKPTDVVSSMKVQRLALKKKQLFVIYEKAKNEIAKNNMNIILNTWNIFRELNPSGGCLANPNQTIFVGYNGEVSPCCNLGHHVPRIDSMIKRERDTYASFGNISETNIYNIWFSDKYRNFRNVLANHKRPEICKLCRIY